MSKLKLFVGIAAALCLVAVSAVPAFAQFEAAKALTGKGVATKGVFEGGGGTVECSGAEGVWALPAAGAQTKENLKVSKWKSCLAKASGFSNIAAEIGACEFELKQPNKGVSESLIQGNVLSECKIVAKVPLFGECKIIVPPTKSNSNLSTGKAKNNANGWEEVAEYANIVDSASGSGCVGVSSTNEAKLKIAKVEVEGQKLV